MDLRVPSGWFFTLLGLILLGMGVFAPDTRAAPLTTENVNLYSGAACWSSDSFCCCWPGAPRIGKREQSMIDAFRRLYGSADGVRVFRAPGRVNLIGEHTDYNLGFVLPVALDLATYVATAPAPDGKLRIYSEGPPGIRRVARRRNRRAHPAPPLDRLPHRRGAGIDPRRLRRSSRPTC
jgi:hypothetical protein